ncbi:hypothetical protein JR316_0009931 [Psilocybe cubensis]|uniref:Uncharacterized protein n=1 Tax=Psilocybe cubensis TaxID=181762 RepID=A0ACB8GQF0_PSICU|nr:hypothetical protein JR316_0009931 [Psilocybe cubensis]KAH9477705.1 hypothetical protein JR316_0009931 [Psilocybe cubensis]
MKPDAIVTVSARARIQGVLLSTPVQFFIAWRIKVVSQSTIMPAIIVFFGICSFIGGVAVFVMTVQISERMNLTVVEPALIVWLGSSAVADALITLSLSMSLFLRTWFGLWRDTARLLNATGTITTIFALADFIVFLLLPATNINFVFDFTLCKLYTNSLLSTLNSRDPQVHTGNSASVGTDAARSITQNDANLLFGRLTKRLTAVVTPGKIIRPSYIAAAGASSSDRKNTAIHEVIELDTKDHARRSQNGKSGLEVHVHKVVGSTLV